MKAIREGVPLNIRLPADGLPGYDEWKTRSPGEPPTIEPRVDQHPDDCGCSRCEPDDPDYWDELTMHHRRRR